MAATTTGGRGHRRCRGVVIGGGGSYPPCAGAWVVPLGVMKWESRWAVPPPSRVPSGVVGMLRVAPPAAAAASRTAAPASRYRPRRPRTVVVGGCGDGGGAGSSGGGGATGAAVATAAAAPPPPSPPPRRRPRAQRERRGREPECSPRVPATGGVPSAVWRSGESGGEDVGMQALALGRRGGEGGDSGPAKSYLSVGWQGRGGKGCHGRGGRH